jgi:hypothetical protein
MDMREFLNAPNGVPQPAVVGNGRQEAGSPQSPLGGKTVCILILHYIVCSWYLSSSKSLDDFSSFIK